jgi:hypothetical protein
MYLKRKIGLLLGLVFGDGHINKRDNCLQIAHSAKQKFYIEYKQKLISEIFDCKYPNLYHRLDNKHDEYVLTKGHKYFKILRSILYKDGQKEYSKRILDFVTPETLALWIMDDGSHGIERRKSTGKIMSHSFHLYTYTSLEGTNNIIEMFKRFGINVYKIKRTMEYGNISYYIKCKTREFRKLSDLVRPYILPGFEYKIMS